MKILLESIAKERRQAPLGGGKGGGGGSGGGGGGSGGGGGGSGGGGSGGVKCASTKSVGVQTDFPVQLLESYVVKHRARYHQV